MIRRDRVIERHQSVTRLSLKHPVKITVAVPCKLQQKRSAMAAVSDVPDMAGEKVTVGAWHRVVLERPFPCQKCASKPLNVPCLRDFLH